MFSNTITVSLVQSNTTFVVYLLFIFPLATGFGLSDHHQANFTLKNLKMKSEQ